MHTYCSSTRDENDDRSTPLSKKTKVQFPTSSCLEASSVSNIIHHPCSCLRSIYLPARQLACRPLPSLPPPHRLPPTHLSQLPVVVVPEALHGPVVEQPARVPAARRDRHRGEAGAEVDGLPQVAHAVAPVLCVSEAQLTGFVLPETLYFSTGGDEQRRLRSLFQKNKKEGSRARFVTTSWRHGRTGRAAGTGNLEKSFSRYGTRRRRLPTRSDQTP